MDKTKTVLREGYLYREEKLYGQADVLYCILKPNTVSFHRRKVHKRHTPLALLKLEEISVDVNECDYDEVGVDNVDCNHNCRRFAWVIHSGENKVFLYCASLEERSAWLEAIEQAKLGLSCTNAEDDAKRNVDDDYASVIEKAREQSEVASKVNGSVDNRQQFSSESIYNSSHSEDELEQVVGKKEDSFLLPEVTERFTSSPATRVRSHSFSEVEMPSDVTTYLERHTRYVKSKSAPPDNGKRSCKTVDKLIDVHTGLCRQLVRWI